MKNRIHKLVEKIKFAFHKESISEPAVFERKLRKLLLKKKLDENIIEKLMDKKKLYINEFDKKSYLYEFTKLFMSTKTKIENELSNDEIVIE